MALSRTDKKLLAIGGGMFAGGKVVDKASGGSPVVQTGGQFTSYGGLTTLGFVGAGETVEAMATANKIFVGQQAKNIFATIRGMGTKSLDMIEKDTAVAERIVKAGMKAIF